MTLKYLVFPGRNTILCGGACIMAADTTVFYITTFLIVLCGAMFFAFEAPLTYAKPDFIPYGYLVRNISKNIKMVSRITSIPLYKVNEKGVYHVSFLGCGYWGDSFCTNTV